METVKIRAALRLRQTRRRSEIPAASGRGRCSSKALESAAGSDAALDVEVYAAGKQDQFRIELPAPFRISPTRS